MTGLGAIVLIILMTFILIVSLAGMWAWLCHRRCRVIVSIGNNVVKVNTSRPDKVVTDNEGAAFESGIVNGIIDRLEEDEVMP